MTHRVSAVVDASFPSAEDGLLFYQRRSQGWPKEGDGDLGREDRMAGRWGIVLNTVRFSWCLRV